MGNIFEFEWEISLIRSIQEHFGKFAVLLSQFFSLMGQEYPLVLLVLIFYFCVDKRIGRRICINLLTVLLWTPMIKNIFFRIRPYFAHDDVKILLTPTTGEDPYDMLAQGYSFPSAHSSCSAAAYPSIAFYLRKKNENKACQKALSIIAAALTFCIGVSRFCVGAHYPTDVLAGWLLGIGAAFIVPLLYSKLKNENLVNIILLISGMPGLFYCKTEDYFTGFGLFLGAFAAFMVEIKYIDFKPSKTAAERILRVVFSLIVFLAFAQGIKYILGQSVIVRVIRYAAASFMALGIYPLTFKYFEKGFRKKS